jgi:hypothetical protein
MYRVCSEYLEVSEINDKQHNMMQENAPDDGLQ